MAAAGGTVEEATLTTPTAFERLTGDFGGRVIAPGDPEYDRARAVYNGMIDRRPALVVRPAGTADVIAAVSYAREQGLPISVRCGGHSAPGHGTNDDGLVVDLSLLRGVRVDPVRRLARAGGGALWGEYDRETQVFGLATPGGRASTTGVGGFTLGGGYGWISPKYGLTSDNLVSVDVVTADGRLLTASEDQNEELFWGLRGGGGNFGIVTSFEFRLHPVGPTVAGGLMAFELERAPEVMAAWRDLVGEGAPDEVGTAAALLTAPPEEFVPERMRGKPAFGIAGCWCGDVKEGLSFVDPIKRLGPVVDLFGPMPYRALQSMLDPFGPPGFRNYWRGEHLAALPDEALDAFLEHDTGGLHPLSFAIVFQHGGQVARVPDDTSAAGHRDARFLLHPIGCWKAPDDDEKHVSWVKSLSEATRPYATGGVYLNFTADTTADRVRAGFGATKYERLVALKDAYDPDNVFRFNQNVAPSDAD
jgi:FAD/FMN-containing dehydrogenase